MINRNYDVITFILKYLYFKRSRVAIFDDIMKVATMFIKKIFEDLKKVKVIRKNISKYNLYLYFSI